MEKDMIYFGEQGLTATSANFVANQAKEYCQTLKTELDNISFVDSFVSLIGSPESPIAKGSSDISFVKRDLNVITKMYSLIAWLREAIKAKENLLKELTSVSVRDWAKDNGIDCPEAPERPQKLTKDEVIASWSIKDRNRYLALSTKVSVYGKFVHPDGSFAEARKDLKEKQTKPIEYKANGQDTLIIRHSPSVETDVIDKEFFSLQSEWRAAQAELNGYEHKIQTAIDEDTQQKNSAFVQAYSEYSTQITTVTAKHKAWQDSEQVRIANLKIVIPNDLQESYETIANLSKNE